MSISARLNLEEAISAPACNLANPNRRVESRAQMRAKCFGEISRAKGKDVDVLCHAGLINVSIDGLSAKKHHVRHAAQVFKDRLLDRGQWQRFAHQKFLKCQRTITEHSTQYISRAARLTGRRH